MSQAIFHFQVSLFPPLCYAISVTLVENPALGEKPYQCLCSDMRGIRTSTFAVETRRWLLHLCECTENKLLSSEFSAPTSWFVITNTRHSILILDMESPSHALPNHTLLRSYWNCFLVSWWHYSLPGRRSLWGERIITLDGPVIWEVGQTLRKCTVASFSMTTRGMAVW